MAKPAYGLPYLLSRFYGPDKTNRTAVAARNFYLVAPSAQKTAQVGTDPSIYNRFILISPLHVTAYAPDQGVAKCLKFYEDMKK